MATLLRASNIVWQSVYLTDQVTVNLQYDTHQDSLNIFIDNDHHPLTCHVNVRHNVQSKICLELSTHYVYDLIDDAHEDSIDWKPSLLRALSSSYDEQTTDHDDGYSTHSSDDSEHQSLIKPASKLLIPFDTSVHHTFSVRRLIEQSIWLNPFQSTVRRMMMHRWLFHCWIHHFLLFNASLYFRFSV